MIIDENIKSKVIETLFGELLGDYKEYLSSLKVITNSAENDYTGLEQEDFANAISIIVRNMEKSNRILDKCFELTMSKCNIDESFVNEEEELKDAIEKIMKN